MVAEKKPPRTARRKQSERSEETRQALFDATIDLLYDTGFNKTSTPEIARKAGVSRGALTHHFSTKEDLVTSAVADHLASVNRRLADFAEAFGAGGGSTDEIVDYLWQTMFDRLFYVTLEYLPEARHNDSFREGLIPVVHEFHDRLDDIWTALATYRNVDPVSVRIVMNATMCLIRGMIAQTVLRPLDSTYYEGILSFWKQQVRAYFSTLAQHAEIRP
ncbi:AcrR family transcriptional regulator [Neorhizobium galegae]|uniref:TetR/AcrR family transcriptional regulator n=1 Tax=Neorhizobium galegae TaxID=399 RepID=UPI001AE47A5D|nr:TetR/AcrR family transcriptional regulator [Neorhizobium galegae]MBP2563441.1 AcrR family transcriptional regulator [Neorhizobium galegae]MDQ0138236.1 AcrR family transcriptional regulator [Neorhizobium galegae]